VVHENVNEGWRATLGGHELRRVTVDGWQQGYVLPAGTAGVVRLEYAPDRWYRLGLGAGLAGVLLLLLLAARPERRTGAAIPASGAATLTVLGGAGLVLAGGWWVLPLVVAAAGFSLSGRRVGRRGARFLRPVRHWGAPVCFALAGMLVAWRPWPDLEYAGGGALSQLLCLCALVLLWAGSFAFPGRGSSTAGSALRRSAS
jgi:arabinofuranan 3-O-arabinosyltransferase